MAVKAKKVSNYELFYDLVFVLATASLMNILHSGGDHHEGITWYHFMQFIVGIISVWNVWFIENGYLNRYSERDSNDIYTIIAGMLVMGNAVIGISSDWRTAMVVFNGWQVYGFVNFNALLIIAYAIIILQYLLHSRRYKIWTADMRFQVRLCLMIMGMILLATVTAFFLPENMGAYVFPAAYVVILILPRLGNHCVDHSLSNFPHMVERMQLITILSFGETVIAMIRTYPLSENILLAICSFGMVGFLFIMYISQTAINIDHHQDAVATLLLYAHIGVLIAIDSITAGAEMAHEGHLDASGLWMIYGGVGVFYLCLFATSVYNKEGLDLEPHMIATNISVYVVAGILLLFTHGQTLLVYPILAAMTFIMVRINWKFRRAWVLENISFKTKQLDD